MSSAGQDEGKPFESSDKNSSAKNRSFRSFRSFRSLPSLPSLPFLSSFTLRSTKAREPIFTAFDLNGSALDGSDIGSGAEYHQHEDLDQKNKSNSVRVYSFRKLLERIRRFADTQKKRREDVSGTDNDGSFYREM